MEEKKTSFTHTTNVGLSAFQRQRSTTIELHT